MSSSIALSNAASQLLANFQQSTAPITQDAQTAIDQAHEVKGKPLSPNELSTILAQQMPSQKAALTKAKKACANSQYHCDGKKGNFLTQLIDFRIEKEQHEVHTPKPPPPVIRDPLYTKFIMDNDAQCTLLFNARDVDASGRPLLMKAVVREGVNVDNLDFSGYRTKWDNKPDIQTVGKKTAVVTTKDTQESEFAFGDALLQVSLDGKGKELSRGLALHPENKLVRKRFRGKNVGGKIVPNTAKPIGNPIVTNGAQLDQTPVKTFNDRVKLTMSMKDSMPAGSWLEAKAQHVDVGLDVAPGLIFEPDSQAQVTFIQTAVKTAVPADDAFLVGSKGMKQTVPTNTFAHFNLKQLLTRPLNIHTASGGGSADATNQSKAAWQHIFADAASTGIAGRTLKPLGETILSTPEQLKGAKIKASYCPVAGNTNGQQLNVELGSGFLSAKDGASVKNWCVVAGFVDAKGQWQEAKTFTNKNKTKSGKANFTLSVEDAAGAIKANRQLEFRVFNGEGIPAERIRVPMASIDWS